MIELRTLGGLSLQGLDAHRSHALLARPRSVALLVHLVLAPAQALLRRDSLVALFWPESDESHARAALRKAVWTLRGSLGDGVLVARGDDELGIDPRALWCDAVAFRKALDERRTEDALALYPGDLLPGFFIADAPAFEEWLERERAWLRQRAVEAAGALATAAKSRDELALAAHWGRRALLLAPDDESALRRLMTVLDRLGDRSGALRAYEELARHLASELEVEPSRETKALAETIRSRGARAPAIARPASRTLGARWAIEREVARGGLVTTFTARDLERGSSAPVQVKVLRAELAAALDVEAFIRALAPAVELRHPHIVPIECAGAAEGSVYYVTPAAAGETLRARLERLRELPVKDAVRVLRAIADALAHAHVHGVVHHDLKPNRVMLSDASVAITDIGVAPAIRAATRPRASGTIGVAMGTPGYTAPELALADPLSDHRADIYALGAIAYLLLTGRPPVGGASPQEAFAAQVLATPDPIAARRPTVPPTLAALIARCLEKRPADRPQTAAEVRDELASLGV